jgi:hypothetical protein
MTPQDDPSAGEIAVCRHHRMTCGRVCATILQPEWLRHGSEPSEIRRTLGNALKALADVVGDDLHRLPGVEPIRDRDPVVLGQEP